MSAEVVLRDYREADMEQIFTLMEEIYDPVVVQNSRSHFRWQYHDNPRNPRGQVPIRVVEREGEIVATICGIRQDFSLAGRVASGLWVVDFMARQAGTTSRERARFGQRLAYELRDTQPLVAGVNRPALNRYWKRVLGDQVDICAVPMMLKPLQVERLARRKLKNPAAAAALGMAGRVAAPFVFRSRSRPHPPDLRWEAVERFDGDFDRFWALVAPTFRYLAIRDAAYLNWRYRDVPDREYDCHAARRGDDVVGWVVTRVVRDEELLKGRIVDMLAPAHDVDMWHYLLTSAVGYLEERGADLVHGLGSVVLPLMQAYRESGFRPNPEHARSAQYIAYTSLDGIDLDGFYNGDNWYVTLGDSDTDFATPE